MDFHACLLRCDDGSIYAGPTDDLELRVTQHQSRVFGGWSRAKKEALIAGDWNLISAQAGSRKG
ncbi:MAG: hypothetical protein FP826_02020 [Sphingomonadales bacterium]|nr:hypothetical protein [Sphingomonadales bacterium]MBU3991473.1 hypothetical protein [Alphaproteobacteria bacterium]